MQARDKEADIRISFQLLIMKSEYFMEKPYRSL